MALKSIKDVVIRLETLVKHNLTFVEGPRNKETLEFLAKRNGGTIEELETSMKTEIETLNKAIAILEKESE